MSKHPRENETCSCGHLGKDHQWTHVDERCDNCNCDGFSKTCTFCWWDYADPAVTIAGCPCCAKGHPSGHHDGCDHPYQCDWVEQTGLVGYPLEDLH